MTDLHVAPAAPPVAEPLAQPERGRWALVAGPAALAGLLAVYAIGSRSVWLDESASIAIASQHGAALWRAIAHDGGNMLIYYLGLHALIAIFGDATTVVRLPSAFAAAATTAIVAALGLRLFAGERRIAVTAGLLTAVSLPLVFWGQDARGYALMAMFTAASFLALSVVLEPPAPLPVRRGALLWYGCMLLASLYIGFDTILVVPAQLLLAWRLGRLRPVLATLAGVAVLCIPLLALALIRGQGQLFWVPGLSWAVLDQALVTLTSAGLPPNFRETTLTTATSILTAVVAIGGLALAGLAVGGRRPAVGRWARPVPPSLILPAAWLLVPAVLAVLVALAGEPIELARACILLIPGLALVLAWVVHDPRLPPAVALLAVGALLGLRLVPLVPSYGVSPENWTAAVRYVLASTRTPTCVIFYPEDGRMAFDYYARPAPGSALLEPMLPAAPWARVQPFVERYVAPSQAQVRKTAAGCPRLWIIASHEGQRSGPPASRRDLRRYRRLLASFAAPYPHRTLRIFGYAAEIRVELLRR